MRSFAYFRPYTHGILPTVLILITAAFALGQSTGSSEDASANPVLARIERARALAAVHQLQAAATELENIRATANDVTIRNATTLMLLGIYLEEGNYGRSQSLLDEAFQVARDTKGRIASHVLRCRRPDRQRYSRAPRSLSYLRHQPECLEPACRSQHRSRSRPFITRKTDRAGEGDLDATGSLL